MNINPEDIGLLHIIITNTQFKNNGSNGRGLIFIYFPEGFDLYSIMLEGNVFKHNTSRESHPVIEIENSNG